MVLVRTIPLFACALCLMAQGISSPEESPSTAEYGGPAILSRGEVPGAPANAPISFRPYISLTGIYDNGLIPVSVNSQGQIPTANLFGVELNLGLYGYHTWKHTTLALDYKGDFRHYSKQTYYDGTDQFLSLILTHQPTRKIKFVVRETGGIYTQNYFLSSTLGILDPAYLQIPQNDLFDNRVIFLTTAADMVYQKSLRVSFDLGGEGFLVRRQSTALYGVTGYDAHGDMQYRASRHTTIGADYRFTHFSFTKGFGGTYLNSIGLDYATRLTQRLQFSARIGGARVESSNLVEVPLDPAIAAILGVSFGIQTSHQVHYAPDADARLSYNLRHSSFSISYSDTINPGNGLYLTSRAETAGANYSYTGIRHWNFGAGADYSRLGAMIQTLGSYNSYGGGVGVTRDLGKGFHSVGRFDVRRYDVAANHFQRNDYRVSIGFAFSPGDVPLALW